MRSARKCAISRSAVSRSAFMARRSVTEICAATSVSVSTVSVSGNAPSPRPRPRIRARCTIEIGVSPDRRGEMRIAPQVEAEMAVILGGVFGLGLRAQHHFIHQLFGIVPLDLRQHVIEQRRAQRAAFRERQIEGFQEFLEIVNLLERRFIVHPIDKRQRLLFKHFGRGDIGQDHELFDQFVRIEPLGHDHAIHRAVGFQAGSCVREYRDRADRARRARASPSHRRRKAA